MPMLDNRLYYLDREQSALRLAHKANEAAIRKLHLAMAKEYHARAVLAAANQECGSRLTPAG